MSAKSRDRTSSMNTWKTEEQALKVVEPVIAKVVNLNKDLGLPMPEWSQTNLTRWMVRQERGLKHGARTLMYYGKPYQQVVQGFDKVLKGKALPPSIAGVRNGSEEFWKTEVDFKEKIGPIGLFVPATRDFPAKMDDLLTETRIPNTCNWNALNKALDYLEGIIPPGSIGTDSVLVAVRGTGGADTGLDGLTNGCNPVVIHRWKPSPSDQGEEKRKRDFAYKFIVEKASELVSLAKSAGDYRDIPITQVGIIGQRINEPKGPDPNSSEKYKRLIVAMPKWSDTVFGATVLRQANEQARRVYNQRTKIPVCLGWYDAPHVDWAVEHLMRYAESIGEVVLSADYSHFDRSVSPELLMLVAKRISKWMTKAAANTYLSIVQSNCYNTYMVTPYELYSPRPHGINSGDIYTNFNDCWVNFTVLLYGHFAGYYDLHSVHVQGDDAMAVGKGLNPESANRAASELGFELHPDKQKYQPRMANFLKRDYFMGRYGGIYSVYRALGKSLFSESDAGSGIVRDASVSWQFTYRTVAQANNAVFNPYFSEYIHYLMKGDRHRLGESVSPQTVIKLAGSLAVKMEAEAKLKPYKDYGKGMSWDSTLTNGVIRGEKVPQSNEALFERVYGQGFNSVTFDDLKYAIL